VYGQNGWMGTASELPQEKVRLCIRVTHEEKQLIASAAKAQGRSFNSFVLQAALDAAVRVARTTARTPESVQAAVERAQGLMRPYRRAGYSLVDEVIAKRYV